MDVLIGKILNQDGKKDKRKKVMATAEDVKKYRSEADCSLREAEKVLYRREFCKELRTDNTISDMADTLIRILNFEFGQGYDR